MTPEQLTAANQMLQDYQALITWQNCTHRLPDHKLTVMLGFGQAVMISSHDPALRQLLVAKKLALRNALVEMGIDLDSATKEPPPPDALPYTPS